MVETCCMLLEERVRSTAKFLSAISLSVEDFNEVLEEFPMQRKHFMAEAAKRLENMREENQSDEGLGGAKSTMSIRKWYKKKTSMMKGKG